MTAKMPLAPGDCLVNNAFGFNMSEWRTALVIAIDRGKVGGGAHGSWEPASVLMLVSGPKGESIIQRSFTWISQQKWERVDEF